MDSPTSYGWVVYVMYVDVIKVTALHWPICVSSLLMYRFRTIVEVINRNIVRNSTTGPVVQLDLDCTHVQELF